MTITADDAGSPLRILHVEDNEAHAELVRRGFEDHRIANQIEHVMTGEADVISLLMREKKTVRVS